MVCEQDFCWLCQPSVPHWKTHTSVGMEAAIYEAGSVVLWRGARSCSVEHDSPVPVANGYAWFAMLRTHVPASVYKEGGGDFPAMLDFTIEAHYGENKWRWRMWCLRPGEACNQGAAPLTAGRNQGFLVSDVTTERAWNAKPFCLSCEFMFQTKLS